MYLNGPGKTPVDLAMHLTGIEVIREDGTAWPFVQEPREIRSLDIVGRQVQLGDGSVPPGRYSHIILRVGRAWLRQEGKVLDLSVPSQGLRVAFRFEVAARQATPLFLTWRVDESVERDVFLRPAFTVESRQPELRGLMAYVTNEGSDSVSVVDRDQGRVVSVIEVGRGPMGIALHPDSSRVYVVNGRSDSLSVIDVKTNRILHTVNLEVQGRATDVAITPDGRTLYVANTGLNSVSAIDAISFQTLATVRVGNEPRGLTMDPRGGRLYVANALDSTLSVLDTARQQVVATVTAEVRPYALAFDENGTRLFVGHLGSANLLILSPVTLRPLRSIAVGMGVVAVLPDQTPNRLFVAQQNTNQVLLFDLQLGVEVGRFAQTAGPRSLALDPDRGKLYVVNRAGGSVGIYDRVSRQSEATVQVGTAPYGIAIVR
jgi:YVTN family beta-propeller protein